MKIEINRDALSSALQTASLTVGRTQMHILLSMIYIETNGDRINILSTDLERSIKTYCACNVVEQGSILLPAKKLIQIVKELPSDSVTIETTETSATIKSGTSRFRIVGLSTDDYPFVNRAVGDTLIEMSESDLLEYVKRSQHAASQDESRYTLNGIYFSRIANELRIASTDGKRLVEQTKLSEGNDFSFIFPLQSIQPLVSLCSGIATVSIKQCDNGVFFDFGDTTFWTKTVEGKYPDYRSIMNKDYDVSANVDRELFTKCVNRASLVVSDKSNKIAIQFEKDSIKVIGESQEHGDFEENVKCACGESEVFTVAVNPRFLLESLKVLSDDIITMRYKKDSMQPIQIASNGYFEIIMPLKQNC